MKVLTYKKVLLISDKKSEVFKGMMKEISENSDLESLSITENSIGKVELKQLAEILTNNKQLKYLSFNYNNLDQEAMPFLKKIINEHPHLAEIDLNFNNIDDEAIDVLLPSSEEELSRFEAIKLIMTNNQITEKGISKAKDKLSLGTVLTMLMFNLIEMDEADRLHSQLIEESKKAPIIYSKIEKPEELKAELGSEIKEQHSINGSKINAQNTLKSGLVGQ